MLFLVGLLTACTNDEEGDADSATLLNIGDKIPSFTFTDAEGEGMTSSMLDGKVFILNFFDTRCPDCQQELQVLQRIYEKYGACVPVINLPRSQTKDEIQAYWDNAGFSMPFFIPSDQALYYKFAKKGIPRTYVINDEGTILAAFSDSPIADYETLETILLQRVGETEPNDSVNVSMRVNVLTRGNAIDEYYFHNEYTISRLDVYFFDAETKKLSTKAVVYGLTQAESLYNTRYDITYIFDHIRVRVGVYDVFTIANYNYAPDEVEDEMELLNMVDSITYKEGVESNIPDKGPVMTNRATSFLAFDFTAWANKSCMIEVELERVMSKLQIGVSQNTFQLTHNEKKYADINITNYKLVNLNKQYYLFQHKDSLSALAEQPVFSLPRNFSDYNDEDEQYVVDPLFYKKTLRASDAEAFRNYYLSWFGTYTTDDFASMPSADNYGYAYILENTTFKTSQKNGYSPGIVFKAAVNPVFVFLYDTNLKTLVEENRPEYWPKTIYFYNYNFYGSIQSINVATGLTLDELETYTDAQLKLYGIKQCKFNMGVYETYYTYWIKHRSDDANPMGPMEYGIVRNHFYRLTITGISGIGESSITPDIMRDNHPNSYSDVMVN